MSLLSMIVSLALLVPFFGWGVYTLRVRYQYQEELNRFVEVITVAAVAFIFVTELSLLRYWMVDMALYGFTALALGVSMMALYGHVLISLTSSLFVDALMPDLDRAMDRPQFGPAEALERLGDYDGALQEYLVIARIFPKDCETGLRVANSLLKTDRNEDAVKAFGRALPLALHEEQDLLITNRLVDLFQRKLGQEDKALDTLCAFLERHPRGEHAEVISERITRMGGAPGEAPERRAEDATPPVEAQAPVPVEAESPEPELAAADADPDPPELELDLESEPEPGAELELEPEPGLETGDAALAPEAAEEEGETDLVDDEEELSLDWSSADELPDSLNPATPPQEDRSE